MTQHLLDDPVLLKFLKSTSVAFPFDRDPWGVIAAGLRIEREEVLAMFAQAQEAGWVQGIWGEPNLGLEDAREALVEFPTRPPSRTLEGVVRWAAEQPGGSWIASVFALGRSPGQGWHSKRFFKSGLPLSFGEGVDLLRQGEDRTSTVGEERVHIPPLKYEEVVFSEKYFVPQPLQADGGFWMQLAEGEPFDEEETRLLARKMVYHHVWRRFALRPNMRALGWEGSGMAVWKLADLQLPAQAEAAAALAVLRGTGDVVLRDESLCALFVARDEGAGESAAREVARQWGRELATWTPLLIE